MRSSIACIRCRRSKVKCVNSGVGTPCRSCENTGRDCAYPSPATATSCRRRDSLPPRADGHGDGGERRQRSRKSANAANNVAAHSASASRDSPKPLLDALDPTILTSQLWQELFDIFQVHYSADLPFLHPPTFLKPLRHTNALLPPAQASSGESATSARPPASPEFLLAFLALTARFHPRLVAYHSPPTSTRPSNPLIASEYYAAAANERLATIWTENLTHDIQRIQTALMLGLHEWGMCRGAKAWLTVGLAIRAAQAMGLQYELDLDDEPLSRSVALPAEVEGLVVGNESARRASLTSAKSSEDAFILQEIRRRTFWSCYIMDRYLSSGKYRPQMLHARELRIQLPASERSFLFAEQVRTLMLGEEDKRVGGPGRADLQTQRQQSVMLATTSTPEPNGSSSPRGNPVPQNDDDKTRLEVGTDEGLVSRYVKILEIYGKVVKWSCAGGRRIEEHPPWDPRCEFYKLRQQCQEFKASLPRQHTLTPQNTQAHISLKTSTPYALVHTVYLLCQIMLHREYVPFIPIRCSKPEGPVDAPLFPASKYDVPPGFWEGSARDGFRAAREIMDLVRTCQEWNVLVETPLVGFAIYTVAFVGVYCINFPWMDPHGYMCTRPEPGKPESKPGESKGFEAARKALEMIGNMRTRLHMADGWFTTINRMHRYFRRIKSDYRKNAHSAESASDGDSPVSTRHLSLREGGTGGGLDEFKLLERTLNDFGNLEDQDVEMTDVGRPGSRPLDTIYDDSSAAGTTVKSEEAGERTTSASEAAKTEGGAWSAINTGGHAASDSRTSMTPMSAQFRSYDSYSQQSQAHPLPSLPPPAQPGSSHQHSSQVGAFRPAYSESAVPPSLTSPTAQSTTGTTPSQHPSPPYQRGSVPSHPQSGYNWASSQNNAYQLSAQPPNSYGNGAAHHFASSQHPTPSHSAYPTPGSSVHPPPDMQSTATMHDVRRQQVWDPMAKEAWLDSINTRLGGDDVAAFVDGGEISDWTQVAAAQGFQDGWLTEVWRGRPA